MDESKDHADGASFAEAFEASLNFQKPEEGEVLRGTIESISGDDAFIAYGGPTEAVMAKAELTEEEQIGDSIEATVVTTTPQIRLSRKLIMRKASLDVLSSAFENQMPVEGKIGSRNKGGFDVSVSGFRAFCPLSQIDLGKIDNPDDFVGKTFDFRIIELSDDGRKLVVSRSAILREAAAEKTAVLRSALEVGAVLTGKVKTIVAFGAFIDFGGIEGLLHVSEMSRRRVNDPKEIVSIGQEVTVKIIKTDVEKKKLSLSMKDLEDDPWVDVAARFQPGTSFSGKVARATDFGLFVELESGVDGLVHVSQLPIGMKMGDPSLEVGTTVTGWVREVDGEKKRISLALREVATSDPWEGIEQKYGMGRVVEGTVERAGTPGVFVQLEPGLTGLIPISELNLPHGSDPSKVHKPGEKLAVKVLSLDTERKRISLSHEAAKDADAQAEYQKYQDENSREGAGKTALALAFQRALGPQDK